MKDIPPGHFDDASKNESVFFRFGEEFLFYLCCLLAAARCQMNESFPASWRITGPLEPVRIAMPETPALVLFAVAIFTLAACWLILQLFRRQILWRKTALLVPLLLLAAAGIISTLAASNKNIAVISALTLISQVVFALLLVQLLSTPARQRLLLGVIAATGVVMAYRGWEQYQYDLPAMLEMFRENPQAALLSQGLEPGSFAAEQFAGRIKSRDIGGFFAISNTAASFFILSLTAAGALLVQNRFTRKTSAAGRLIFILTLLFFVVQAAGLWLTRSKGGIGSFAAALLFLAVFFAGRRAFSRHWRRTLLIILFLIIITVTGIIFYGLKYDRLPTASLWVRWQYWQAAAAMIRDHIIRGVGPQNFGLYYPRYMNPAAVEVVTDPHCLPLALWTQWGLLGFLSFLAAVGAVSLALSRPLSATVRPFVPEPQPRHSTSFRLGPAIFGLLTALGVFMIRRQASDLVGLDHATTVSVYLLMFFMPAFVWWIAFLLTTAWQSAPAEQQNHAATPANTGICLILAAGLVGFLLHNCIDFAFFQPGVGTCFFALAALALAVRHANQGLKPLMLPVPPSGRVFGIVLCVVLSGGLWMMVIPVLRGYSQTRAAQNWALAAENLETAFARGWISGITPAEKQRARQKALALAEQAGQTNPLDPEPAVLAGRLAFVDWVQSPRPDPNLFIVAVQSMKEALRRNPADYSSHALLSEIFQQAWHQQPEKREYLEQALEHASQACRLHPAKAELYLTYADLLSLDKQYAPALQNYQAALDLESRYKQLHRQMFPGDADLQHRLSPALQQYAEEKIKSLQNLVD